MDNQLIAKHPKSLSYDKNFNPKKWTPRDENSKATPSMEDEKSVGDKIRAFEHSLKLAIGKTVTYKDENKNVNSAILDSGASVLTNTGERADGELCTQVSIGTLGGEVETTLYQRIRWKMLPVRMQSSGFETRLLWKISTNEIRSSIFMPSERRRVFSSGVT